MVLQYKLKKGERWIDYKGKEKFKNKDKVSDYDWRLVNQDKTKVLVKPTNYTKVMKRFRQIEWFKRH